MRCFWNDSNNFYSSLGVFFEISIQSKVSFKNLNTVHIKVVVPFRRKYTAMNVKDLYTITTVCCSLDWRGYFKSSLATSLHAQGRGALEKSILNLCALHSTFSLCKCYNTRYHSVRCGSERVNC